MKWVEWPSKFQEWQSSTILLSTFAAVNIILLIQRLFETNLTVVVHLLRWFANLKRSNYAHKLAFENVSSQQFLELTYRYLKFLRG